MRYLPLFFIIVYKRANISGISPKQASHHAPNKRTQSLRQRTIKLLRKRTCTDKIRLIHFIKVFARLFSKSRVPRVPCVPPVSPVPRSARL